MAASAHGRLLDQSGQGFSKEALVLAPFRYRGFTPYVLGIAGVVVAWLLRSSLDEFLGEHLSFAFDYLAVFVAACTGGLWPALATAILSALVGNYFFTQPHGSLAI